ncbi:hypothetical protein BDN70DRAFT_377465 [Pholiota conissans]|uniref:Uncharacterized protein n=1 Tax=Pholiota conissans TaxID=109636 RepID=A0A9P5YRU7_9AGAR|nr:hypothetical protein BDN70DRAFT_377465 [Pholiota conissans]
MEYCHAKLTPRYSPAVPIPCLSYMHRSRSRSPVSPIVDSYTPELPPRPFIHPYNMNRSSVHVTCVSHAPEGVVVQNRERGPHPFFASPRHQVPLTATVTHPLVHIIPHSFVVSINRTHLFFSSARTIFSRVLLPFPTHTLWCANVSHRYPSLFSSLFASPSSYANITCWMFRVLRLPLASLSSMNERLKNFGLGFWLC